MVITDPQGGSERIRRADPKGSAGRIRKDPQGGSERIRRADPKGSAGRIRKDPQGGPGRSPSGRRLVGWRTGRLPASSCAGISGATATESWIALQHNRRDAAAQNHRLRVGSDRLTTPEAKFLADHKRTTS